MEGFDNMKKGVIIAIVAVVILLFIGFMMLSGDSDTSSDSQDSGSSANSDTLEDNPLETSQDVFSGIDSALENID